jgi:nucleoside triphosphate diphosphatase
VTLEAGSRPCGEFILNVLSYIQHMDPRLDSATDAAARFAEAVSIMERLRAPGGCPWDREQTIDSIQPYTLEEAYEVFDAIDRRHWPDLCDELGDLLLQVLFYAQIAADEGHFTIKDVVAGLNRKLVRRHPHVFGDRAAAAAGNGADFGADFAADFGADLDADLVPAAPAIDSAQVLRNWDEIKKAEKTRKTGHPANASVLDAVSRAMPALSEARKLGSRARKSGFDWPQVEGLFDKLREEISELRHAMASAAGGPGGADVPSTGPSEAVVAEIGDLLFTAVNLARHLKVDPEFALRHSNSKFRKRFAFMEREAPGPLETLSAAQLELLWSQAKKAETPEAAI